MTSSSLHQGVPLRFRRAGIRTNSGFLRNRRAATTEAFSSYKFLRLRTDLARRAFRDKQTFMVDQQTFMVDPQTFMTLDWGAGHVKRDALGLCQEYLAMVGIRQVAAHLGLSIYTVSRALNGQPDVNANTRRRVIEAARELGYEPNRSSVALRTGKTGSVGFVMRTGPEAPMEGRFFLNSVLDGVQTVLHAKGIDLMALLCPSDENPDDFLRRAVARQITDALIVTDIRRADPRVEYLLDRNIPFVAIGQSGSQRSHLWFDADIQQTAKETADRLCAAGHRTFAIFTSNGLENFSVAFAEHFAAQINALGLPLSALAVYSDQATEDRAYQLATELARTSHMPSAAVVLSELMTLGVYRALHENGLVPDRDVTIVCWDSPIARLLYPAPIRFQMPLRQFGVEVAHGLLRVMKRPSTQHDFSGQRVWPVMLIEPPNGPTKIAARASDGDR